MHLQDSVTQIIVASRSRPELLGELERFRRNIAVMFTDIKGSTSYFEKYGDIAGLMMVSECNDKLRSAVERHGGHMIKTIGDAIMASFDDCPAAVQAAVEMQCALRDFNLGKAPDDRVSIRVGLNYGTGIVKSSDVFGDVVNVASRVESAAHPDQIVISGAVSQQISPTGLFQVRHLGKYALKGKEGEFDLFEVLWNKEQAARPPAGHTMVAATGSKSSPIVAPITLVHLRRGEAQGSEHPLIRGALTVGSGNADLCLTGDPQLAPLHARFVQEQSRLYVEDLSGRGVFVRLEGTGNLQSGDVIQMGRQTLEFRVSAEALAAAAATGTAIIELNKLLEEPVAKFISVQPAGAVASGQFPLLAEDVTWGRTRGTYIFPEDGMMSSIHARVYQRGEDYFIEDLGSRNGTFLKARGKTLVPMGTTVQIGSQQFKVNQ
jgi:adenylate cyclase